jgi:hypothetical protein
VWHVLGAAGDGRLETLLGAPYSFLDERLAAHYGAPGVTGSELRKVDLSARPRRGLLTQGSFLATHAKPYATSPVRRGHVVLARILCAPPPPPPPGLEVMAAAPDPGLQVREQLVRHTEADACRACHAKMDAIGFAFEGYDTGGFFEPLQAGRPVNTRVEIPDLDGQTRRFDDAVGLVQFLSMSPTAQSCMVKQWMRFALGRFESRAEAASVEAVHAAFAAERHDVRALLIALVQSRAFRLRAADAAEVK